MIPFITSRSSTWRLLPPRLAGGINGSISAHSSSVRSLGYRNALRSYRPRFFDVHIGDPPRIRPPLLNHKQLTGFNMFSDRHSENWRRRPVPVITSSRRSVVASGLSVWSSVDTSRSPIQRSHNRPSPASDEGGITTALTLKTVQTTLQDRSPPCR